MTFRVEITDLAATDIDNTVAYIAQDSLSAAASWLTGLETLILSLQEMPGKYPVIAEFAELQIPYRNAVYYSHRVVYRIDEKRNIVYIVRLYHGARHPLTSEETLILNQ